MSDNRTVNLAYHQARVNELLATNNQYQQRYREAEKDYRDLTNEMKSCEAHAFELADTIVSVLLPDADDAKKRHEATILSQRIYDFVQDFL